MSKLRRPKLVIYRAADPGRRFVWNRYGSETIGAAYVVGSRCFSFVWARPS